MSYNKHVTITTDRPPPHAAVSAPVPSRVALSSAVCKTRLNARTVDTARDGGSGSRGRRWDGPWGGGGEPVRSGSVQFNPVRSGLTQCSAVRIRFVLVYYGPIRFHPVQCSPVWFNPLPSRSIRFPRPFVPFAPLTAPPSHPGVQIQDGGFRAGIQRALRPSTCRHPDAAAISERYRRNDDRNFNDFNGRRIFISIFTCPWTCRPRAVKCH